MRLIHRPIRLIPLSALAVLAAGCGGGSDAASGPAAAVPTDAQVYVEAAVRPEGDLKSSLESIAGRFPQLGEPASLITSRIDSFFESEGVPLTYSADVEPWLGERAGVAFLDPAGDTTQFIVAVETT